jgi:hypothetical protein
MISAEIQNFLILLITATAVAYLLWQLVRPWKRKEKKDCDKCG